MTEDPALVTRRRRRDAALAALLEELYARLATHTASREAETTALDELGNSGDWLVRLVDELRPGPRRAGRGTEAFSALLRQLEQHPEWAAALGDHVARLLATRMHRVAYAEASPLPEHGFRNGLWRRLLGRILPPAPNPTDLSDLIQEVFHQPDDHVWLSAVPREEWRRLFELLDVTGPAFGPARAKCHQELAEALRLEATRLAALGTDTALLQYLPALARHESPFMAQQDEVRGLAAAALAGTASLSDRRHVEVLFDQCSEYLAAVRRKSREAGVSVGLVFLLARIEQVIERERRLLGLQVPDPPEGEAGPGLAADAAIDFTLLLVRQHNRQHSVRDLFRGTTQLLARRITEQASTSGEHYITESRAEFVGMYRAAAGAGFIIAVMALCKLLLARADLPLFWEAVGFSLNYGLGFVLIHVLHLTIATKQPAMTAATLAAALDGRESREARLEALADLAAKVSRTQWVSIAGNVTVTMLAAFAIALLATRFAGWQPAPTAKAAHLLADLHPWHSLALLHAAIAGVYLFLSGLIAGYYDNQALYHRVPDRLRRVRSLRRLLGAQRLDRLATYAGNNLGALAGNFLFGCMLGCTPVVGTLLGLPLDIRHVAFASANLAYGLVGLQFDVSSGTIAVSILGVLLIGLVNLAVSFGLALRVALRSRGITPEQTAGLWSRVLRRFLAAPRDFFWPGRTVTPDRPA
jgi:site-specific recombinase